MATLSTDKTGNTPGYLIQWCESGFRRSIYLGGRRFSKKTAERLKDVVELLIHYRDNNILVLDKQTQTWLETASPIIREKLAKVGLIELPEHHTCGELWTTFLKQKNDVKPQTYRLYEMAQRKFFAFFSEKDSIYSLNRDKIRDWMDSIPDAPASIALYVKQAKAVFNWARDQKKWIKESPLSGISGGSFENHANDRIITLQEYRKLLNACPDQEWRLIISLARIGGLRCPSELMPLRWFDFDFERKYFVVHSPKTERHSAGKIRDVPIFPELLLELRALQQESAGREFVINGFTHAGNRPDFPSLGYKFDMIAHKAGLGNLPRPFDNMRASRSNELRRNPHVGVKLESIWLGHSPEVADNHYFFSATSDYELAAKWETPEWLLTSSNG
jgi:integrase